jgi:two-component system sensor histidine kinase/response regulator
VAGEEPVAYPLLESLRAEEIRELFRADSAPTLHQLMEVLRSYDRLSVRSGNGHLPWFEDPGLLAGLVHDLRSPLTSILFLSDTLRAGWAGPLNDVQKHQAGVIYTAAFGLVSMANDILDLFLRGGDIENGGASSFSIHDLAQSVRDILAPIAEERKLELRLAIPELGRRIGPPVSISRVLLNLASNGLKFTDEGLVEVGARAHGPERVEFYVRDTGRGITPEEQAVLFEPIRPVRRKTAFGFSGTGLGLSLARHLVRSMGSELSFETRPGAGARFSFQVDLPVSPDT